MRIRIACRKVQLTCLENGLFLDHVKLSKIGNMNSVKLHTGTSSFGQVRYASLNGRYFGVQNRVAVYNSSCSKVLLCKLNSAATPS